jgi:phage gp29-like protein
MGAVLDVFGNKFAETTSPTQFRNARRLLESEIAVSRLLSFMTTVPDPDEMLKKAGIKRYQLRQLELDDEVAQAMDTRTEAVISTPWRIEPQNSHVSKWIRAILDPHVEDLLRGAMEARYYGYSVFEVIYKQITRGIGIDRISMKPQQWFSPQRDGTLRYFPDDGSGGTEGIEVSPLKFLLVRCNPTYENPYGKALLSPLYFPVTWRREGFGMWLQFLETFGEPIVLGMVTNYEDFVEAMRVQGVRSTIAWKSVTDTDKVDTINASTPGEFERLENAIIRRIQKLILGQTMTSDVGNSGSYAAAAIHNEVRNDKRRADLRLTARAGQDLVNMLCTINRWPAPKFCQADDSGLELARAQRDHLLSGVLTQSGFKLSESYFLDRYDLRANDLIPTEIEEEDIVDSEDEATGRIDDGRVGQDDAVSDRSVTDE